ncbi:hypothetical protein CVIRNUC_007218 [Coccomyxa viridis]|uniref:dolichyl-phosphate beta-glucosyltransferase n=1 Tax=Coccomyxa viridis TaxID=1274662 RepID=A0AAV1IBW0_9CHLO|nr:hypothetical protein CVIRNUC_007218 [Coccomyxa viridis]
MVMSVNWDMHLPFAAAAVLIVAGIVASRSLRSWFLEHDEEAADAFERLLDGPYEVEKIPASSIFSEATKSLSIIVPAFNEEKRLPSTLDETLRYLQRRRDAQGANFTYEVVVVDDGSSDGTSHQAFKHVRQYGIDTVRVLRLPRNHGKGYAVKTGMMVGRGELLLFMDADGATRVSDIEKLEAALAAILVPGRTDRMGASEGVDVVEGMSPSEKVGMAVGSRAHLEAEAIAHRSWHRNLLMHGFHFVVLLVAGSAVKDTQCGFKLFTRKAAQLLYSNQRLQRWCFDVELLFLAQLLGVPTVETSVTWMEIPGSKVAVTSIIHMIWEMAAILIAYKLLGIWTVRFPAEVNKLV